MSRYQNANIFNEEPSAGDLFADTAAFESFFKKNFVSLCAYCQFKFALSLEQSKDVVHTSFIKFWESRHVIASQSPVKPFLYRIINNSCLDILKHDKVKKKYERYQIQHGKAQDSGNELESIEFKQLSEEVQTTVAGLPLQMQKIFKLCKYDGLTYTEVAVQLNLSVKTVEKQMGRALFKLRQKLSVYLKCCGFVLLLLLS